MAVGTIFGALLAARRDRLRFWPLSVRQLEVLLVRLHVNCVGTRVLATWSRTHTDRDCSDHLHELDQQLRITVDRAGDAWALADECDCVPTDYGFIHASFFCGKNCLI